MSSVTAQRRRTRARAMRCDRPTGEGAPRLFDDVGGGPTLEEMISGVWEGLAAHGRVACPVCGGAMEPRYGAHAKPIGGRCGDCGSALA